jgi:hypothetical protein
LTPDQVVAVGELLDDLREQILLHYASQGRPTEFQARACFNAELGGTGGEFLIDAMSRRSSGIAECKRLLDRVAEG